MPCAGCGQARSAFVRSVRTYDVRGMVSAVRMGVAVNVDKLRGVDVEKKYGGARGTTPVVSATPYRRPPEKRTT